jgi:hypothetical protein
MKTESTGGRRPTETNGESNIEERLASQFAAEMRQAEEDYPTLPLAEIGRESPGRTRRSKGMVWPRLAIPVAAVAVLAIAGLVAAGLAFGPAAGPAGRAGSSDAVLGADGIPTSIDGERVYRVGETVEPRVQGWYLLGGYVFDEPVSCPVRTSFPTDASPGDMLLPACGEFGLGPTAGSDATTGGVMVGSNPYVLSGWVGAPVVVRAKGCLLDNGTPCPPVVDAVVWPVVPTEIGGERVYRAADQASFPTSGSFLLGGRVAMPDVIPPCPMPIDRTTAENDLIPYCYWQAIDGIRVAPKVDALADLRDRVVVARVHVDDPEWVGCPATVQAQCQAAVVVEEVVWTGAPSSTSSLGPTPIETSPVNAVSSGEGVGPGQSGGGTVESGLVPTSPVAPPLPSTLPLPASLAPRLTPTPS